MFRFLMRMIGLLLVAAGFVGLVVDGTRSIANGRIAFSSLGEILAQVMPAKFPAIEPALKQIHPVLWDPIMVTTLMAPASILGLVLGAALLWLGQKPVEPIGYLARR